jgi:hypothetical protein
VERFLAPALSFVTFLFAVEKKSKLPQSAREDEVMSTQHIPLITTIYFSFRTIDKTSWLAFILYLPLGHKSPKTAP